MRHLRPAIAAIAVISLIAASCNGDAGDTASTTTTEASTTGAPATTTTTVTPVTTTAQDTADDVIIAQADAPSGYIVADDIDEDDTACDGVLDVGAMHPPDGVRRIELNGGSHFFGAQAYVYDDPADAAAAFAYARDLRDLCDGKFNTGEDGEAAFFEFFESDDPDVDADERTGFRFVVSTPDVGIGAHQFAARIGGVALVTSGTDEATTRYLLAVMVAKARGNPPPTVVEPEGSVQLLPGLEATSDGTGSAEAGIVRGAVSQIPDFSEAATTWLDQATDADIDALAAAACRALDGVAAEDLDAALSGLYDDLAVADKQLLDVSSYGQLVGASLVIFCPEVFEALGT